MTAKFAWDYKEFIHPHDPHAKNFFNMYISKLLCDDPTLPAPMLSGVWWWVLAASHWHQILTPGHRLSRECPHRSQSRRIFRRLSRDKADLNLIIFRDIGVIVSKTGTLNLNGIDSIIPAYIMCFTVEFINFISNPHSHNILLSPFSDIEYIYCWTCQSMQSTRVT